MKYKINKLLSMLKKDGFFLTLKKIGLEVKNESER